MFLRHDVSAAEDFVDTKTSDALWASGLLVFPARIGTQNIKVLFDPGAEDSFISEPLVQDLSLIPTDIKSKSVVGFDGFRKCEVTRQVRCRLTFTSTYQDEFKLNVIPMKTYQVILGKPWFNRYNPTIDWPTNTITFNRDGQLHILSQKIDLKTGRTITVRPVINERASARSENRNRQYCHEWHFGFKKRTLCKNKKKRKMHHQTSITSSSSSSSSSRRRELHPSSFETPWAAPLRTDPTSTSA